MTEERIMPGAQPERWEGNEVGVLISHGFTGTPHSVRPLAEALAAEGFTVAMPRLAGHGTTPEKMARTGIRDWLASLEGDLAWLEARTDALFITGLSMGGMFALYLAALHPEVRGLVSVNGVVFLNAPQTARRVFDPEAPELLPGIGSDTKDPNAVEVSYEQTPTAALAELMAGMRVTDDLLPTIAAPALVIQSREDHVVPPPNGPYILDRLGSTEKELLWLENSYHVATLDHDADLIAQQTIAFVHRHSKE